jgi:hypothetical protein
MNSIDSVQKQRTQSYNLVKGNLTNLQRKRASVSLATIRGACLTDQGQLITTLTTRGSQEGGFGREQRVHGDIGSCRAKVSCARSAEDSSLTRQEPSQGLGEQV